MSAEVLYVIKMFTRRTSQKLRVT